MSKYTFALLVLSATAAHAQPAEPAPPVVTPAPPVAAPTPPPPAPPAPAVDIAGAPGKGVVVKFGDTFSFGLRARTQLRYAFHAAPADDDGQRATDALASVGTLRLYFAGNILRKDLTWLVQLAVAERDYRDGTVSPVFDAYLDWKAHRDLSVRAGQFFVPFDRLRTVREFALQLAERPRPVSELSFARDVGIVVSSERFLADASPVAYKLGVFGGNGPNVGTTAKPGGMLVGRLELRPLGKIDDDSEGDLERRAKPALALGVAAVLNRNSSRQRAAQGGTFVGGTADSTHLAADLVFKWRGAAVQAQYLKVEADRDTIVATDPDGEALVQYTRSGRGYIFQGSYVFSRPVELVGRFSRLFADANTDPRLVSAERLGQELAAGVNYYLNGHFAKLQATWIGRTAIGRFANPDHTVIVQVDATF